MKNNFDDLSRMSFHDVGSILSFFDEGETGRSLISRLWPFRDDKIKSFFVDTTIREALFKIEGHRRVKDDDTAYIKDITRVLFSF